MLNRGTGLALSGMLYAGALTFLLNPIYPVIDSAHLIEFVAGMSRHETHSQKAPLKFARRRKQAYLDG